MSFGLTNAPSTFQRFMNEQLVGMESFARVYMDDIIVFSRYVHEHMAHLRQVLLWMQARQLAVKERKCEFMRQRLTFLGHVVSAGGVSPDPRWKLLRSWLHPLMSVSYVHFWVAATSMNVSYVATLALHPRRLTCWAQVYNGSGVPLSSKPLKPFDLHSPQPLYWSFLICEGTSPLTQMLLHMALVGLYNKTRAEACSLWLISARSSLGLNATTPHMAVSF